MSRLITLFFSLTFVGSVVASPAICKRTFSSREFSGNNAITVTVEINKGATSGVAKLIEEIPDGLMIDTAANSVNTGSANGFYTFEKQILKIVWPKVPSASVFKVTYRLKVVGELKKDYHILGKYSYMENDVREEFFLAEGILFGNANAGAVTASVSKEIPVVEVVNSSATESAAKTVAAATISTESASTATVYKVQLGVFGSKKDASVFKSLKDITNEEVNGKYKYYSGSFSTKEEAEKCAAEAKKLGFSGAYVVSFVGGKRVN